MSNALALKIEAATFARIAKTPTAHGLVSVFLGDQLVKKLAKKASAGAKPSPRASSARTACKRRFCARRMASTPRTASSSR